jgi:RHS repeat-associated protein
MYDEAGRLAGEYDGAGKLIQETIWFGDLPVATLRPKSGSVTTPIAVDIFYVHADHLGTPRVITRPSDNKIVWKWDSAEAFGNSLPNENPSALGTFTYNLRMPGQYFDKETGNFYNYFRDYDPSLGRYVQSDPIGLAAGPSTYGYVGGRPLSGVDRYGLFEGNIGDYLKPAVTVCVRASTVVVASSIALAAGLASYSGNAGDACDTMEKPDSCYTDCAEIERAIAGQKELVIWRYFRMLEDSKDLYNRAMIKPLSSRSGSWVGHVQQFQDAQKKLRKLIDMAKAKGCKVDPDAVVWANAPAPDRPADRP